jgi:transcriptional regulator with XRE-family HTH domain
MVKCQHQTQINFERGKKMPELEKLRAMLADRNLQVVAREAGVHPNALYRLKEGKTEPKYETVRRLLAYFDRQAVTHG